MQYLETESSTGHPAEEINRCWDPNFLIQTNRKTPSWRAGLVRVCASSGGKRFISTQGFLFFFCHCVFKVFAFISNIMQYTILHLYMNSMSPPWKKASLFPLSCLPFSSKGDSSDAVWFPVHALLVCWPSTRCTAQNCRVSRLTCFSYIFLWIRINKQQKTRTWIHLSKQVCRKCWKLSNTLATVGQYTNSVVKSTDFSIFHSYHESSSCFHLRWNLASSSTCLAEQFTWRITATDAKFFLLGLGHK